MELLSEKDQMETLAHGTPHKKSLHFKHVD